MAKDLASCGISTHEAFQGEFKHPSVWILDSAISVLACEAGLPTPLMMGATAPSNVRTCGTGRLAGPAEDWSREWFLCA
eukprot:798046-Amphidinium_carterae.1